MESLIHIIDTYITTDYKLWIINNNVKFKDAYFQLITYLPTHARHIYRLHVNKNVSLEFIHLHPEYNWDYKYLLKKQILTWKFIYDNIKITKWPWDDIIAQYPYEFFGALNLDNCINGYRVKMSWDKLTETFFHDDFNIIITFKHLPWNWSIIIPTKIDDKLQHLTDKLLNWDQISLEVLEMEYVDWAKFEQLIDLPWSFNIIAQCKSLPLHIVNTHTTKFWCWDAICSCNGNIDKYALDNYSNIKWNKYIIYNKHISIDLLTDPLIPSDLIWICRYNRKLNTDIIKKHMGKKYLGEYLSKNKYITFKTISDTLNIINWNHDDICEYNKNITPYVLRNCKFMVWNLEKLLLNKYIIDETIAETLDIMDWGANYILHKIH